MNRLLLLNGSHSDIPLIKAAKKLGYHVITSGNRPDLVGHPYADEFIFGDFSKPELMLQVAQQAKVDAICSCSNDFGAISASYVAEKLGFSGHDSYETTLILHHKDKFKEFSRKYDIPTPLADDFSDLQTALAQKDERSYPLMVKPIDLTGGKGVTKVEGSEEFEAAVRKAFRMSPAGRIVMEPYIEGTHHSFSTFLVNRKVSAYYSDNEYSFASPFLVSTSAGPATAVDVVKDELIRVSEKIADILRLKDGVFHIQYILSGNKPYILEITRRCSGDMYPVPVEHSTGIPWAEWIVRAECGMNCDSFPKGAVQAKYGGRHCIVGDKNGPVSGIYISPEIAGNIYDEFIWLKKEDGRIDDYLIDKIGIVFLDFKSREEMIEKTEHIMDYIHPIYK